MSQSKYYQWTVFHHPQKVTKRWIFGKRKKKSGENSFQDQGKIVLYPPSKPNSKSPWPEGNTVHRNNDNSFWKSTSDGYDFPENNPKKWGVCAIYFRKENTNSEALDTFNKERFDQTTIVGHVYHFFSIKTKKQMIFT